MVQALPAGTVIAAATADQVDRVQDLAQLAFDDLAVRDGRPPEPVDDETRAFYAATDRYVHQTDPDGFLAATDSAGVLQGVARAYLRGSGSAAVWALSLLAVRPGEQGSGVGSALLRAALDTAPTGCRRVFFASRDARALRAYARSGHLLLPALRAAGAPDRGGLRRAVSDLDAVRDGDVDRDAERVGLVDQAEDLRLLLARGGRFLVTATGPPAASTVTPDGPPQARVLSAADVGSARRVLAAAAATSADEIALPSITASAQYALDLALEARLTLGVYGPTVVANMPDALTALCPPPALFI
ncbi:MAG TPA: GNAT family N-acetyltransferase [Mycobacteriales bacterium]